MVEHYLEKKEQAAAFTLLKELAVLTPDDPKVSSIFIKSAWTIVQKKDAILYLRNSP